MKKNYKQAIVTFVGGLGVFPILMATFTDFIDFGLAIVIAATLFLLAVVSNGAIRVTDEYSMPISMYRSQKQSVIIFIAGLGIIVLLIGVLAPFLTFEYALVISYGFFLISAVLFVMIAVEQEEPTKTTNNPSMKGTGVFCPSCGAQMESKSIFCDKCGARVD